MNKTILTLCGALLGVIVLTSHLSGQVAPRAQKWEYGFIEKGSHKFRSGEKVFESKDGGFASLYASLGGVKPPKDPDRAEDAVLQLLGQGGWELTAVDADRIYFKRPIQ